ncbi:MAG: hypothetical protein HXY43_08845 [Fischerella sp.]|uniref:hypothetical protein n=1 Tax=Fischerella sp. TaxID=1191 RepID=UPI001848C668|nr:hypothetical protein [Fischerella sp.]NWF59397.1 hypothetical protein [Fischerella sp.]
MKISRLKSFAIAKNRQKWRARAASKFLTDWLMRLLPNSPGVVLQYTYQVICPKSSNKAAIWR